MVGVLVRSVSIGPSSLRSFNACLHGVHFGAYSLRLHGGTARRPRRTPAKEFKALSITISDQLPPPVKYPVKCYKMTDAEFFVWATAYNEGQVEDWKRRWEAITEPEYFSGTGKPMIIPRAKFTMIPSVPALALVWRRRPWASSATCGCSPCGVWRWTATNARRSWNWPVSARRRPHDD